MGEVYEIHQICVHAKDLDDPIIQTDQCNIVTVTLFIGILI